MAEDASYIELHAHSAFSFLDGASTPTELAAAAATFGYPAFALTDHDGVWGSMEFVHACKGLGIRAITGAEVTLESGSHLTLLVEDAVGYRNLCRLAHSCSLPHQGQQAEVGRPALGDAWSRSKSTPRGWSACRGARGRERLPRPGSGARWRRPRRSRGDCFRFSETIASGSSCSGPTGGGTGRGTAGSRGLAGAARRARRSPPATSTRTRAAAPTCRTRSSRCGWA